ncbi:MAG TPA: ABC transporter permease subunit, partial [Verrucomicrobiota bacterium]|nr:ABC transporter permease subunit [Verrucomicrobiota bacterium]
MNASLLLNSLAVALGTLTLAWLAGLVMAIATATASPRTRRVWLGLTILNLALPPFLIANVWLDLTATWRSLSSPQAVAGGSLPLTALAVSSLLWPLTSLLMLGGWGKLQPEHLEADSLGRGWWLLRRLLLPAARAESIVAAAITLVLALANFTVPTLFQVRVFTEEFWIRFNTQFDLNGALRATWPLLVVPVLLLLFLRGRSVSWPRRQVSLPPELLRHQLGGIATWARYLGGLWLTLTLGMPLFRLLLTHRTWTELAGTVAAGHSAIWVSAWTAAGTATLVVSLGLLAGGSSSCGRLPRWIWLLFLVPGVLLGVGLILLFNRPGLGAIYQRLGIVFLALTLRYLAPGWSLVSATLRSVDSSLVDVARSLGAGRWRVLRDAILPQSWRGLAAAWYAVYLLCLWDVETVVLIQP